MTKRIYCDDHLPSALKDCPRCIEEENKKLKAVVDAARTLVSVWCAYYDSDGWSVEVRKVADAIRTLDSEP